jgi:mono/diheme cytochrome c family protein
MNRFWKQALHNMTLRGVVASAISAAPALAVDGDAILKQQCAVCHALEAPKGNSIERLWERKGPDLHYAGAKFNRDWLVGWLQNPTRIRPAGTFYTDNIKAAEPTDLIDDTKLKPHPKLAKADAESAADALMALKGPEGLVPAGAYGGAKPNMRLGEMSFAKLRGCSACHQAKAGEGGLSGPELQTAALRLKPDYMAAYIKDPQRFDAHIWMPRQGLSDKDVQLVTGYLLNLSPGEKK